MDQNKIKGSKILVIGGAGLIGSHVVDELVKEDIEEIVIYDNFNRGSFDNIEEALSYQSYLEWHKKRSQKAA